MSGIVQYTTPPSHTGRNVLLGIAVLVLIGAIVVGILAATGKLTSSTSSTAPAAAPVVASVPPPATTTNNNTTPPVTNPTPPPPVVTTPTIITPTPVVVTGPISAASQTPLIPTSIVDPNNIKLAAPGESANTLTTATGQWDPTFRAGPYQLVVSFPATATIAAFTYVSTGDTTHDPPSVSVYGTNASFAASTLIQANIPLPVGGERQTVLVNLAAPVMTPVLALQLPEPH